MPKIEYNNYCYVDVWYTNENEQNKKWKRVNVSELNKFQNEEAGNTNCFSTIQRFLTLDRSIDNEEFIAPLYFDLDYDDDPEISRRDALKIVEFFINELDCEEVDLQIFFSGSKGFHILVDERALGIKPGTDLHRFYKYIAGYLKYKLGDEYNGEITPLYSVDYAVYTKKRLLRLPNSVHGKTGLYKRELSFKQLKDKDIVEIKKNAALIRRTPVFAQRDRDDQVKLRPGAARFIKNKYEEYVELSAIENVKDTETIYRFKKDYIPACVEDFLHNGWKKEGDRNQATVQLAAFFKESGHDLEEAVDLLTEWVMKFTSVDTKYQEDQRKSNTKNVVETVYSTDTYNFSCKYIRALHGEKIPGSKTYDRVMCSGKFCECVVNEALDNTDATAIHLCDSGKAEYTNKRIKTRVMVAGKKSTPYILPKKIEYSCWASNTCKKDSCPMFAIPSKTAYKELDLSSREFLEMCGSNDDGMHRVLRKLSGIHYTCKSYSIEVIDTINLEEMLVIPLADSMNMKDENSKYVLRKIYAAGENAIEENKYYELTGFVFPHPKNQESTILVQEAEPLQDMIKSFELTDEVKETFKMFKPASNSLQDINDKLQEILNDLTYSVTKIVDRDETLLGILLVYHSILRFNVSWDTLPIRGWLELAIVGDTGTGKSAAIDKMMNYCKLGTKVNAESTSRTGLTYKMEQNASAGNWYLIWGAWPLSDKEIIWIDEMTGIPKEAYGEMTMARSEGKLEVKRAVTAETNCRVRAILSGNAPMGKRLSDYTTGCYSLTEIFNNEDIRRFDFGIFMKSTDVDSAVYNQYIPDKMSEYTSDIMKDSILFAWSRKPKHVVISEETSITILNKAMEISKIYGNATDVPLVSPSDQRNKIARLSVALASILKSTDETGEKVVVLPAHVEYIAIYLKTIYNSKGCSLNYHSKLKNEDSDLTEEQFNKLLMYLEDNVKYLKGNLKKQNELMKVFGQQKYVRKPDLEAMLAISTEETKDLINTLVKMKMVIATSNGYKKTNRFNNFISKTFEYGLFDEVEEDII